MLQKVTRLDSVPTAEETVLTTEVPTKESRLYTLLWETEAGVYPDQLAFKMLFRNFNQYAQNVVFRLLRARHLHMVDFA